MARYLAFFMMLLATSLLVAGCGGNTTDVSDDAETATEDPGAPIAPPEDDGTGGPPAVSEDASGEPTEEDAAGMDVVLPVPEEDDAGAPAAEAPTADEAPAAENSEETSEGGALSGLGSALGRSITETFTGGSEETEESGDAGDP